MNFDRDAAREHQRVPVQPRRGPDAATRHSAVEAAVLELQKSAGNAAVGQAVAAKQATQPAPANKASGSVGPQLGALWNSLVIIPLAKVSERLSRDRPDLDGAAPSIDEALRGIRIVKGATPSDDENFIRVEILERRVEGVRDLVAEQRGNTRALEKDMIRWRSEAVALGPDLKYPPRFSVGGNDETADIAATYEPGDRSEIAQYWKESVVGRMWEAQQDLQTSVMVASITYRLAGGNILRFMNGAPVGEPTRLRLMKLYDGLEGTTAILDSRQGEPLISVVDLSIEAYGTAETVGKYLTGQEVDDEEETKPFDPNESSEPKFTWEKERQQIKNDTELERP